MYNYSVKQNMYQGKHIKSCLSICKTKLSILSIWYDTIPAQTHIYLPLITKSADSIIQSLVKEIKTRCPALIRNH